MTMPPTPPAPPVADPLDAVVLARLHGQPRPRGRHVARSRLERVTRRLLRRGAAA